MVVQLVEGCDVQQNFWVREMIGRKVDGLGWRSGHVLIITPLGTCKHCILAMPCLAEKYSCDFPISCGILDELQANF